MAWKPEDFSKFTYITSVRISPSGDMISYTLNKVNIEKNKYENTIVLESLEKRGARYFLENASLISFSPDGKKLLFMRKNEESKEEELYVLDLATMSSKKIFTGKNILQTSWKDPRTLAILTVRKREDEDLFFEREIPVWFNEEGFRDSPKNVVKILDVESTQVLDKFEDELITSIIWMEDSLVYAKSLREDPFKYMDILRYKNGKKEKIFEKVSFYPVDSEDGSLLLLGKPQKKYHHEHDFVYLWNGKGVIPLTEKYGLNNSFGISTEVWAPSIYPSPRLKEGTVYFLSLSEGKTILERIREGNKETLVDEESIITCFDVSKDGKVVFTAVNPTSPIEIYLWNNGKVEKLTSYNDKIAEIMKIVPLKHFKYKSHDGLSIDAWYLKPEKTPAPLVVFVHGGPKGAYGYINYFLGQLLVNNGFYVLYTNPRGSNTYSEDFADVRGRTGLEDFQDIMEGIKKLIELEDVDKDKIGITGISYGGFMTNWAITQTDMFKAAVSENGISYWFTSYAFSDIGYWFDKELIGKDPMTDENYRKLSPIFYAQNVKTPILLIHSLEDYRCPLDQSLMFFTVLRDLGKEAYIAIFKKGAHGHSIRGLPRHRLKRYRMILEFFKKKLVEKKPFDIDEVLKEKEDRS
mgnify:CR=1 FL=1